MSEQILLVDKLEGGVAMVTLNNPKVLNALGVEISRELSRVLGELEADPEVRVIVIRGAGRAFSSGGNLRDMRQSFDQDPDAYMDELTREVYGAVDRLLKTDKPVIAQVHGVAYGAAFNLVMACDLAVAARDAVFCESFTKLGLIPGGFATVLLPAMAGPKRAAELCLTAREVGAEEAYAMGLINMVVEPEKLEEETMKLARRVAKAPPLAIRETKRLLRESLTRDHDQQAKIERETQIRMAKTKDYREGINAFFEKRKPEFKGE